MANAADVTFKEVVREACLSRDHFMAWTDEAGNVEAAAAQMAAALGVDARDRIEDVEADILDGPYLPRSRWDDIAFALEDGSKSDNDQAGRLREAKVFSGAALLDKSADAQCLVLEKAGDGGVVLAEFFGQHRFAR